MKEMHNLIPSTYQPSGCSVNETHTHTHFSVHILIRSSGLGHLKYKISEENSRWSYPKPPHTSVFSSLLLVTLIFYLLALNLGIIFDSSLFYTYNVFTHTSTPDRFFSLAWVIVNMSNWSFCFSPSP